MTDAIFDKLQRRLDEPGRWVYTEDLSLLRAVDTAWAKDKQCLDDIRKTVASSLDTALKVKAIAVLLEKP